LYGLNCNILFSKSIASSPENGYRSLKFFFSAFGRFCKYAKAPGSEINDASSSLGVPNLSIITQS
jgi:hypothetical protein